MIRVELEEFPRDGEIFLHRLGGGVIRAQRDEIGRAYVECETEEQVYALKKVTGNTGPPIELERRTEEVPGLTTHDKSVAQCKVLIEQINFRAVLTQLLEAELSNPKFPSGRPKVIKMIDDRLEQVRDQ